MSTHVSIRACADELGVHYWIIWRLCRLGIIPSIRVGTEPNSGPYRIPIEAWEKWKRSRLVRPPRPTPVPSIDGVLLIDAVIRGGAR